MEHTYQPELWRDLFVMLGTSAAALIGLLFVVTSIRIDEVTHNPVFKMRARNLTLHLLALLVQAMAILTPQPMALLGAELVIINLCGMWLPVGMVYQAFYRDRTMGRRGGFSFFSWSTYFVGYLLGAAGGAALVADSSGGLYLVTISYADFLVSITWNAWKIMFGTGVAAEPTQES